MSRMQAVIKRENEEKQSKLSFTKGESLLLLCQKAGIAIDTPCSRKGVCGKCRVRFLKGAPLPQPVERRSLSSEELRAGLRLACAVKLTQDCEIVLPKRKEPDAVVGKREVGWRISDPNAVIGGGYFIAADLGTTTIVMELRDKRDGRIAEIYRAVNAQRRYGADVLSRMEASLSGERKTLSRLIRDQLTEGVRRLSEAADEAGGGIDFMVIAANTAMVHLLMGYDVTGLSRAPFLPETLSEIVTEIGGLTTYVMPGVSAFVGGDITAGLHYAVWAADEAANKTVDMATAREAPEGYTLLIDLGTNAELVLYRQNEGICCATAAGPAFEGGADTGLFGSDLIAVMARLYRDGVLDATGTFDDAHLESGADVFFKEGDQRKRLHITQRQMRQLQLAKAAVRCGIEVLLQKKELDAERIERVLLAGGFGYYLDVCAAVQIGLLPKELEQKTVSCGNTALLGAALYGYRILTGQERTLPVRLQAINLAEETEFNKNYVNYINLDVSHPQD